MRWLLEQLDGMGARRRALLFVPATSDEAVIALLRAEAANGSEVVLHGYDHLQARRASGLSLRGARAALFAHGAAEFVGLERGEIRDRVRLGRDVAAAAGLDVRGFCAPAWLGGSELRGELRAAGFRFDVGMQRVTDLERGGSRFLPSFGYLGADSLQEQVMMILGRLVVAGGPLFETVGVFLHPQGARRSRSSAAVLRLLAGLLRDRQPCTYGELLD